MLLNGVGAVRFIIELYAIGADGSEALFHRLVISALNPGAARKQAAYLLGLRKKATGARVLNMHGDVIYDLGREGRLSWRPLNIAMSSSAQSGHACSGSQEVRC